MRCIKIYKVWLVVTFLICIFSFASFSQDKVLTIMSTQTDLLQKEATDAIAKEFQGKFPDVQIDLQYLPWSDVYSKVITGHVAGILPEVATPDPSPLITFAAEGLLLPLDDIIEEIGKEDFYEEGLKQGEYQGQLYGVPYRLQALALYYRKDIFKEKNLEPPTNLDEWLKAAKALTEDTNNDGIIDRWGCALPYGRDDWTATNFYYVLWSLGGMMFDENNDVVFNSPQTWKAMEFYKQMFPYSPPGSEAYSYYDSIKAFISGKVAMTVYYGRLISSLVIDAPELKDKVGAVLIPIAEDGKRIYPIGGGMLVVFKNSKHPDLGKEFIKHFMTSKHFADFCNATPIHAIPSRKSVADSVEFRENEVIQAYSDILEVFLDAVQYSVPAGIGPSGVLNEYIGEIRAANIVQDAIQRVVLQDEPVEDAAKWADNEMKMIIEKLK